MKNQSKKSIVPVTLGLGSESFSMDPESALKMISFYFPKQTKSLLTKALNKAQKDRRLDMSLGYVSSFNSDER